MCSGKPLDQNELEHMTPNEIIEEAEGMDYTQMKGHKPDDAPQDRHIEGIPDNREGMD